MASELPCDFHHDMAFMHPAFSRPRLMRLPEFASSSSKNLLHLQPCAALLTTKNYDGPELKPPTRIFSLSFDMHWPNAVNLVSVVASPQMWDLRI